MPDTTPKSVSDLLRSIIPLAVASLAAGGEGAEAAAREAVRTAAAWLLDDAHAGKLRGHELNRYAIEQLCARPGPGLDKERAGVASSGLDVLAEGLLAASTRQQHGWGWAQPRYLSEREATRLLRGGIQHLVNVAVFQVTGDTMAAARAQDRVAGHELDAEAAATALEGVAAA